MTISFLLYKYPLNGWFIWCLWNCLEWIDSSQCDLYQRESSRNFCYAKLQKIFSQFFNLKIICALSIFENVVASKVFAFTFVCAMLQKSPVGEIQHLDDEFEYVVVACTARLWYCGHNGYLLVHISAVINILPGSVNISTTIRTPKLEVFPITLSHSGRLVVVGYGRFNSGFYPISVWVLNGSAIPTENFTDPPISVDN